jgi:hypothetical protein
VALVLKNLLTQNCLPGGRDAASERGRAEPGTLFYCRDTKAAFLSLSDGRLLNLADVVDGRLERESVLRSEIVELKKRLAVFEDSVAESQKAIDERRAAAVARVAALYKS